MSIWGHKQGGGAIPRLHEWRCSEADGCSSGLQVEHILTLMSQIFALDIVLVCLCAHERVYIRNAHGFSAGDFPFRWGFCGWGIATENPECLVIEDARQDARSAAFWNPQETGLYCE
jgi:hypothetical protein